MTTPIKTYDCKGCSRFCYGGYHMEEVADGYGDWVSKEDHDAAMNAAHARIAELEAQIAAVAPAVDAHPVAWRIFDGEGGYDYRDEPPPEVNVAWAAKHGRKYEPLYTDPQSSQSAQSEPVAWANVKDDGTIVGLSQHPEDIANWQNPRPLCYQCKGCGDSEYGPWRCSRCEGSGFESAPNAAQSEGLRKDAERYRWLRNDGFVPADFEKQIDAALSKHTGEKS